MQEEKESQEAIELLHTLKQLRILFKRDIKAYLIVTSTGVILEGIHSLDEIEIEETENPQLQARFNQDLSARIKMASLHDTNYIS